MRREKGTRSRKAIEKEIKIMEKQEASLRQAAGRTAAPQWKLALAEKVPDKVYDNLQKAFCKAFCLIFEKGTGVIERTYDKDSIVEDYEIRNFAFQLKADRKSLKKVRGDVGTANMRNMALASVEGIGLGVLGIGLPDIVIFVGVLLKGIYETALHYGFDYQTQQEQYFILKLMETAMQKGNEWELGNQEIDRIITGTSETKELPQRLERQIKDTAEAFAVDMVLLKFIQGLPVVGIAGGAGNPLYYRKVIKYVEVKYRKRYLLKLQNKLLESA